MKKWIINCSIDGINIDYQCIIESAERPDFWTQYHIAQAHGCNLFTAERL